MKNFKSTLRGLAALSLLGCATLVQAQSAETSKLSGLLATDTNKDFEGTAASTQIFLGTSYNFSNDLSGGLETRQTVHYREGRVNDTKIKHDYLRFPFKFKNLASVTDGLNLGLFTRWSAPTDNTQQRAGSFGMISVGPYLEGNAGPFSLLFRDRLTVNLQRSRSQRYSYQGSTMAPNDLFSHVTELEVGYPFTEHLKFTAAWTNVNTRVARVNGSLPTWKNTYDQDYELSYSSPAIYDFSIGVAVYHASVYGDGVTHKFWSNDSTYNLRIARGF